jgi:TonB-linked SusC/RagA family outer membrane protein
MPRTKCVFIIPLLLYATCLFAQTRTITGKVITSKDNAAVSGATVSIKGTTQGVSTLSDGSFSIQAPPGRVTLQLSSVGFATQEINVDAGQNTVTINLTEDIRELGEVVITALGIERQAKTLTYATQRISGERLNEAKEVNVINALQGKIAGVTITKNATGPGSSSKVLLRGSRSITGNNQPLYVIDGVPMDNSSREQASVTFGGRDGGDGIGMINADDIESINVLKGAAAAALYGSAGQNGAIIIETKRGRSGKVSIDLNSGAYFDRISVYPEFQYQYGQGDAGEFKANSEHSFGPKITGQNVTLWNGTTTALAGQPDRIKEFFRTGKNYSNSIAVSGGSDKMQTYFSYGNTYAEGILRNHDLRRHSVTLKNNINLSSRFSIESKITYINESVHNKPALGEASNGINPVTTLYRSPVSIPLSEMQKFEYVDSAGNNRQSYWKPNSSILENPYWVLNRERFTESRDRILGLINAKYNFTTWLNLQLRGSIDKTVEKTEFNLFADSYYSLVGSNMNVGNLRRHSTNFDALLNFNQDITNNISLTANLGGSIRDGWYEGVNANANGLNKPNFFFMGNAKAPIVTNYHGRSPQVQSVYAWATLGFRNYLFLDATARNDWSSALPEGNQSYFYPSVGISAVISDMTTLPSSISFGKVRLSYAQSGAGGAQYLDRLYYSVAAGGRITTPTIQPFSDFKPELTKALEAGLEWRFLNNRLGFDMTLYKTETKNQLLLIGAPSASLFDRKYINAGLIKNSGIELQITGTPLQTSNFSWNIMLNYAANRNKVVRLTDEITNVILVDDRGAQIKAAVGGSYGDMYVKGWLRDSLGRRLVDTLGKIIFTSGTTINIGNYNPRYTMGLSNSFNFKTFSFSFLIDYRSGGIVISTTQALIDADGHSKRSLEGREGGLILDGYVSTDGKTTDGKKNARTIPASEYWTSIGDRYPTGELYAYSATNMRLREVTFGYRIPQGVLTRTNIFKDAKISLVGRNLFFFKRDAPFDPEIALGTGNGGGLEYGSLPSTRTMGINLKLSF